MKHAYISRQTFFVNDMHADFLFRYSEISVFNCSITPSYSIKKVSPYIVNLTDVFTEPADDLHWEVRGGAASARVWFKESSVMTSSDQCVYKESIKSYSLIACDSSASPFRIELGFPSCSNIAICHSISNVRLSYFFKKGLWAAWTFL